MKINIELEVDDFTATNYQHLSPEFKQKLIEETCKVLKNTLNHERKLKLKQLLEELQDESVTMEIDPEILYEILRSDDGPNS